MRITAKALATLVVALALAALIGCSSGAASSASSASAASSSSSSSTVSQSSTASSSQTASASASGTSSTSAKPAGLENGTYKVKVKTDSTMFHLNEAKKDMGELTVSDGGMSVHIVLPSKNIVNLFAGTAKEAAAEGAVLLEPTTEKVTYDDGYEEEVYGFDVPVPALDEPFDVAIKGTKGTWYDHKVTVSSPTNEQ